MSDGLPRLGCVPYLNARPLIEGISCHVTEMVPAKLFDAYKNADFDAALLSSIDVISQSHPEVSDGIAIASRGDVYSVVLAYTGDLRKIGKVRLDPSSHTSNALLQIILEEFYDIHPEYVRISDSEDLELDFELPTLLIGDPAISCRNRTSATGVSFLDLGAEWFRFTSLPFVYALWALRKDYTDKKELSGLLRTTKNRGLLRRAEIAARNPNPEFAQRYLTEWIRYDLGNEEKKGLKLFAEFLQKKQLISNQKTEIVYF